MLKSIKNWVVVIIKIYLIYKKDKFVGHTTDKRALDQFLKIRPNKYKIIKVSKNKIDKNILNSSEFKQTELDYFRYEYGAEILYKYPLFNYEIDIVHDSFRDDVMILDACLTKLCEKIEFIKFKKLEFDLIITSFTKILETIENSISIEEEFLYEDIFDINKYIKYTIINE